MKILTDLGHPKNVHIIKNLIPLLEKKGHEIHVVYREREHIEALLRAYGISGTSRGKGATGILGKLFYLLKTDLVLLKLANRIKPDLLLSFGSPYLANLALFMKIPMIVFDDTEQNRLVQGIYSSYSAAIVVPACFGKTLNRRQFHFAGYFELAYLSPRFFLPAPAVLKELDVKMEGKYVLLRFVSWHAVHDINHRGLSAEEKRELVAAFSKLARVFISAEAELPEDLEPLRLKTPPEAIHQVMAHAGLVFSEGATMAAEAAVLGVPTIYFSDLKPGYIADLESRFGLLHAFPRRRFNDALAKGLDLLQDKDGCPKELKQRRMVMLNKSVDVNDFLTWFIEQYPLSVEIMAADPKYAEKK